MTPDQFTAALIWAALGGVVGGLAAIAYRFNFRRVMLAMAVAFVFAFLLATYAITQ
jgi:hypothetical protein